MLRRVAILLSVFLSGCASVLALGPGADAPLNDLRFTHLTTSDGLSQSNVKVILQDRRGFMWFATRDGLNRYDGNTFVTFKHNPGDPYSLSANFIFDLMEDDHGYLWIATLGGGVNKFDPATERFIHYRHDANNPNSLARDSVESILRDGHGYFWFGTADSGLDKLDPATGSFTHYLNDTEGQFVGRITKVIADSDGQIWFIGERGLFHLDPRTRQITRPAVTRNGLAGDYLFADRNGNLWMLTYAPIVGLVKYDRHTERLTNFPFGSGAFGQPGVKLLDDRGVGFWVPSSLGLYYFDRRTERFTYLLQHNEASPDSLSDSSVISLYRDRGGVLWVGTENGGVNLLSFQQQQFGRYRHRPGDPNSLSPGKVTAIYEDSRRILWLGFRPPALDKLDRTTGRVTHYLASPSAKNALSEGTNVNGIFQDARGYFWLSGWGGGLVRFDERTGQFKSYGRVRDDPGNSISDHVFTMYGDRSGRLWVGQEFRLSRLDPLTGQVTNYLPDSKNATFYGSSVLAIYQDPSGTLWMGRNGGMLSRFDDKTNSFAYYTPDPRDPHKLQGGDIVAIHQDRAGTLWLGALDGLFHFDRQNGTVTRYTESQGLPSSIIQGLLEDKLGRLWLSTKKGLSRFDPKTGTFRNYDVSDGLQSDEFSEGCYMQAADGEMFFGGSNGLNAFYAESIRDNPYVPPLAITSFKISNKSVSIGAESGLRKAIAYADKLTLSYKSNIFSFEFAALSYANSQKNRYRYRLEPLESAWNEVDSKHRLATYTNLNSGDYLFRVQGSNNDGVWNQQGVSLPITITPPWWNSYWFRALYIAVLLVLAWAAYQFRVRQLQNEFTAASEVRLNERLRIARDLHDHMLQTLQGFVLRLQSVIETMPSSAVRDHLEEALDVGDRAILEGRKAVQDLRSSPIDIDLVHRVRALGNELANSDTATFRMLVEGPVQELQPVVREELYSIAREALRNAFTHASAAHIEAEITFNHRLLRLRVRDDGEGIGADVAQRGRAGHYGLHGMRERARQIGSKLVILSGPGTGTEIELTVPASTAYMKPPGRSLLSFFRSNGRVRT
jgi:signal transduction histidine kinase/streptogramin lyase